MLVRNRVRKRYVIARLRTTLLIPFIYVPYYLLFLKGK